MTTAHSWTQKLLADAADVKVCRNCALVYMRDDAQSGYCKLNRPDRPPEVPLVVDENHTCESWTEAPKKEPPKETLRHDPQTSKRPASPPTSQAKLPKALPKIHGLPKSIKRPPQPFGKRRGPPTPKDDA